MASRLHVVVGHGGATASAGTLLRNAVTGANVLEDGSAPDWPFRRSVLPQSPPPGPCTIIVRDLHRAFPSSQTPGTRLVLTQSTYQLQRWLDWLDDRPDVTMVGLMPAAPPGLTAEAMSRRGPWDRIDITEVTPTPDVFATGPRLGGGHGPLLAAFWQPDPTERLRAATQAATDDSTNAALQLALASAHMEVSRTDLAQRALGRALELDPTWEAVHFEVGKWCLRNDQMEEAATSFSAAARLMPTFAAALGNLGAVLGELRRPAEALEALEHALALDPQGYAILNNIGAVHRDAGRLEAAEQAFRTVVEIAPTFVFGHYNLGQTLLLANQPAEACHAYQTGLALDEQRNPRQMMRLAVARAAAGDPADALRMVQEVLARVSAEARRDLLAEAESTLLALSDRRPISDGGIARVLAEVRRYST